MPTTCWAMVARHADTQAGTMEQLCELYKINTVMTSIKKNNNKKTKTLTCVHQPFNQILESCCLTVITKKQLTKSSWLIPLLCKFKFVSLSHPLEPQMGRWGRKVRTVPVWERKLSCTICCWHHPSWKKGSWDREWGWFGMHSQRHDNSNAAEITASRSILCGISRQAVDCCAVLGQ